MRSHRLLSIATLFTLALTTVATGVNAQSKETALPYVFNHSTFPSERASVARHTLEFVVPANSKSVSAVKLTAPAGFKLSQKVVVSDSKTGETLPASVSVAGETVEVSFNRAIEPGTAVDIELNNVSVWGANRHYDLAVKFAGDNRNANAGKLQVSNERFVNIGRTGLRLP